MAQKITLVSIAAQIEKGFGAIANDVADIRKDTATKEPIVALHTQVNSIETQLRGMKHVKLQSRVADLEDEVFGRSRA